MTRWAAHVEGWLSAAADFPRIVLVRYEDLDVRFDETVRSFAEVLGRKPRAILRPSRDFKVIAGPRNSIALKMSFDREALRSICRQTVGSTMARLDY